MEALQKILGKVSSTEFTYDPTDEEAKERFLADSWNREIGNLNEDDGYSCEECHNKGTLWTVGQRPDGHWTTFSRPCKCMTVRRTIKRMQRSGLKNIIKEYTFDKYHATEPWQQTIKDAAEQYAREPSGWFFIGGQSGAGKTHICTAICREFLLAGKEVRYMLWRDEIVKIKQVVNDFEQYQQIMAPYKETEILYIDDLFKSGKEPDGSTQQPSRGDINAIFEILNGRYNDPKKLTIISSECTINDIVDIDEALGGRIYERARVLNLKPDKRRNYRLKGAIDI